MEDPTTVSLTYQNTSLQDVQVWSAGPATPYFSPYHHLDATVLPTAIPLYLILAPPATIYSNDASTAEFFKTHLLPISLANGLGLLFKSDSADQYLVFYYDDHIRMLVIDFDGLNNALALIDVNSSIASNTFIDTRRAPVQENTLVFDKVLERKKQPNPFIESAKPSTNSLLVLSSQEHINQAVNKVILSGLRIRGLSTSLGHSSNDKLTIKEIYHMTYKAALFGLRKYNYSFNGSTKKKITMDDIQDVVERLLEVFVDVV
ncbi:uncharacterized protein CANTADRAFT_12623 [Suhomyces tanzawaensis NRRL Y-17324]|uniref:Sld7 C-terminal domain-containing protein n=1 Tax=Suhomyces tanzawaensis NRRL Y-17324 TaxID=984487 RepID=A0A1E4SEZ2_9ASCO|nr:uncharacterized protein CANTADRAFT_12623 [Suhomyces tanzawaensis NRRL Y-17324]ODV78035.1 hypothetical protein CANTADRAFT_12623 [Suhomyces tanzawaensis NRRL Y-17324]